MMILFFKAICARPRDAPDEEPLPDKLRRILQSHVDEARTDEDREKAEEALRKFTRVD